MARNVTLANRRQFMCAAGLASVGAATTLRAETQAASVVPTWPGTLLHAGEGQLIPPTPDGRVIRVRIDSEVTPLVQMSVMDEDLPPGSAIRVHLHQHENEVILIRMGSGMATLGDTEVAVTVGATIYVPRGVWHGLRNNGRETLGMTAIFTPPGFEQSSKDRLRRPNRTPAEAEASRKKHGIVYRDQ